MCDIDAMCTHDVGNSAEIREITKKYDLDEYDEVFDPNYAGYNGHVGPFEAVVNMGPVQPPQRKGHLPQYARNQLVELQAKFDELETMGVFVRPEDVPVNVEYLNPSFLIKKRSGGQGRRRHEAVI